MYKLTLPLYTQGTPDTLAVGDTLWFNADFSDTLTDFANENSYLHLENFDFQCGFGISKIDSTVAQHNNINTMDIINGIGTVQSVLFSNGFVYNNIFFLYQEHRYKLKFGLVPKVKGVFYIGFFSWLDTGYDLDFNTDCKGNEEMLIYCSTNNDGDNNRYLLLGSPDLLFIHAIETPDGSGVGYWKQGSYCFAAK
ncbi:MAG: hypothetical protein IPL35_14080 [Sphingobacteriales bacterium]|nr:hypothetical protein [Sphingobacteriales bacterium]